MDYSGKIYYSIYPPGRAIHFKIEHPKCQWIENSVPTDITLKDAIAKLTVIHWDSFDKSEFKFGTIYIPNKRYVKRYDYDSDGNIKFIYNVTGLI